MRWLGIRQLSWKLECSIHLCSEPSTPRGAIPSIPKPESRPRPPSERERGKKQLLIRRLWQNHRKIVWSWSSPPIRRRRSSARKGSNKKKSPTGGDGEEAAAAASAGTTAGAAAGRRRCRSICPARRSQGSKSGKEEEPREFLLAPGRTQGIQRGREAMRWRASDPSS